MYISDVYLYYRLCGYRMHNPEKKFSGRARYLGRQLFWEFPVDLVFIENSSGLFNCPARLSGEIFFTAPLTESFIPF